MSEQSTSLSVIESWEAKPIALKYFDIMEVALIFEETRAICDAQYEKEAARAKPNYPAIRVSDKEIQMYILKCSYQRLNPIKKQVYPMPSRGKLNSIVSIDGLRAIAHRTGECTGITSKLIWNREMLVAAEATVFRHGNAYTFTALMTEFKPKEPTYGSVWNTMPSVMLVKCAEASALRRAFPEEMLGVYTPEEFEQAQPVEKNVTPRAERPAKQAPAEEVDPLLDLRKLAHAQMSALSKEELAECKAEFIGTYGFDKFPRLTALSEVQLNWLVTFSAPRAPTSEPASEELFSADPSDVG